MTPDGRDLAAGPGAGSAPPSSLALRTEEERRAALRALLVEPFVGADHPAFALVRRHEAELAHRCSELLGYRLEVSTTFARLFKVPTARGLRRGVRVPPGGAQARERARDEWAALSDRAVVLLFLTLAALERAGAQTVIGELADAVADTGARAEPPLPVDFDRRAERVAFADGLELLCSWGVLRLTHGSRGSFTRREHDEDDEALFTVDRRRLASVLRDPFGALRAESVGDLLALGEEYAPTADGATRQLRHRLARRLVEDPALYLDELDEEERAHFIRQRAWFEARVQEWVGLPVERRQEGSAAIEPGRELTDLPFPANATRKQLALLLCDALTAAHERGVEVLLDEELRAAVRTLLARHGAAWNRDPDDPAEVDALAGEAADLLVALDLAARGPGGLRPRPLAARFRSPEVRRAGEPAAEVGA
jgi:uncharacterized protein (TIGR02678 family)